MLLPRTVATTVQTLRHGYPAIAVTGPRQSGKSTLCVHAIPDLPLVNLESPLEQLEFQRDPVGFLDRYPRGAILDEAQNIPEIFSYLQVRIDEDLRGPNHDHQAHGKWILTGSRQSELSGGVSQSLAGRVATVTLLPFSHAELEPSKRRPRTLAAAVLGGGYPPLFDERRQLEPRRWLEDYLVTFVQRDVRQILDIRQRSQFDRFLRICAARTGQILNRSELARDCGIAPKTAEAWLSVLEACHVVRLLHPHHRNFGKRLIKSPKLYFTDSALSCRLMHIADVQQLRGHPAWGSLVETWCVGEILKSRLHAAKPPAMWFWRSSDGHEVDVLIETDGGALLPIEIKSAATADSRQAKGLTKLRELSKRDTTTPVLPGLVVYGGDEDRPAGDDRFVPWHAIAPALEGVA